MDPLVACTPDEFPARFSFRPAIPPLSSVLATWRPPAPASSAAAEVDLLVLPLLSSSYPERPPTPVSCIHPYIAVRVSLSHAFPSAVIALCIYRQSLRFLAAPLGVFFCALFFVRSPA